MNQKVGEKPRLPGVIMPQLLTPTYDDLFDRFMKSDDWWLQEMVPGERRLVANEGNGKWSSWNKKGDMLELPEAVVEELNSSPLKAYTVIDGVINGEIYRPFDILRFNVVSMMTRELRDRNDAFTTILTTMHVCPLRYFKLDEKETALALFQDKSESLGVVFKHKRSEYKSDWFKHPFEQRATFQVIDTLPVNRRIQIGAYDDGRVLRDVGFVMVPDGYVVPGRGALVEIQYLHAIKNGGLEKPVYLGVRSDQFATDCQLSKLKYKTPGLGTSFDARWAW